MSSLNINTSQSPTMGSKPVTPELGTAAIADPDATDQLTLRRSAHRQLHNNSRSNNNRCMCNKLFQQMGQNMGQNCGATAQGSPETASFLNNLNLVAEAAKRAQMACLMRDFGDVEL